MPQARAGCSRGCDPAVLSAVVTERRIVDGRNALDPDRWRSAGWTYRALGRPYLIRLSRPRRA